MLVDHYLRGSFSCPTTSNHLVRWFRPPSEFVKLTFNGSLINSSALGGFIIWDWTNKLVKDGATYYDDTFVIVAEARALRDEPQLVIWAGFNNIIIEGDNKIVSQALKRKIQVLWQISIIIEDTPMWQNEGIHLLITHMFR